MKVLPRQNDREVRRGQIVGERVLGAQVALAPPRYGYVDRDDERPELRIADCADELLREAAVARAVELEPLRCAGSRRRELGG